MVLKSNTLKLTTMKKHKTLGILGGGQLGKMLIQAAHRLGIRCAVLDPNEAAPALQIADIPIVGKLNDEKAIKKLVNVSTHITYEIESPDVEILKKFKKQVKINPDPDTFAYTQDKFLQKKFLAGLTVPVAPFASVKSIDDIKTFINYHSLPCVLKLRKHGYDGRGNFVIRKKSDIVSALKKFANFSLYCEAFIPWKRELAIQVGRSVKGELFFFPIVETIQKDGICHIVKAPAKITSALQKKIHKVSKKIISSFKGAGVFGIEFFETNNGDILVNELAPRVHNSGHHTIESCSISQFEAHVRLVCSLPMQKPRMIVPAVVMLNVLGKKNAVASVGFADSKKIGNNTSIHIYGKTESRIGRKMGHITAIGYSQGRLLIHLKHLRKSIQL